MPRFAIYFTPAPESPLAQAAASWLGRDIWANPVSSRPPLSGLTTQRIHTLLQAPRHYGFHATVKPPFRLASGKTATELHRRLQAFAAKASAFTLPPLHLTMMGHFFCLRLQEPPALLALAAGVVRGFDDLRQPPTLEELNKHRAPGLTAHQETMLQAWGYPYVLDEFRFHLTLTGPVTDPKEQQYIADELERHFPAGVLEELSFDTLSLFMEEDSQPLRCIARYPLRVEESSP